MSTQTLANHGWPLIVALLAATPVARANVLVVDAAGAPGTFAQVQPAIAAAADGDVILIRPGTYAGFSNGSPAKALDFVGDVTGSVSIAGNVLIAGSTAARTVSLTGLSIRGAAGASALRVSACVGSVRVQACTIEGFGQSPPGCGCGVNGAFALHVTDSADVCVARCDLLGGSGGHCERSDIGPGDAGDGLFAVSSQLALYDTTIRGGRGGDHTPACPDPFGYGGYCEAGQGGHGATFALCPTGFASNCSMVGGNGGDSWLPLQCTGYGSFGLIVNASSHARLLQTSPISGACGSYFGGPPACQPPPIYVQLSTLTQLPGAARRLSVTRVVREQQPARVDVFGQPGDQVELVFSDRGRFLYSDAWRGVSALRPSRPQAIAQLGTIGPSGTLGTAWIVPDLGAGVASRRVFVQASFTDASAQTTLGTPLEIVLLDSAY